MQFLRQFVMVFLCTASLLITVPAYAQVWQEDPVIMEETSLSTNLIIYIENGVIRDLSTGQVITLEELDARLKAGPVVVGIIIGSGTAAAAAAATGQPGWAIASAAVFGGIAGFYGAIAAMTTGVSQILYGSYAVVYGGLGVSLYQLGPSGGCAPDTATCRIYTR